MIHDCKSLKFGVGVLCLIFLCGCHLQTHDLTGTGLSRLEYFPSKKGYYRDVSIRRNEESLGIKGYVRRYTNPGHVHVILISPEGKEIASECSDVKHVPRSSRARHGSFDSHLVIPHEFKMTELTILRIMHHHGTCAQPGDDCSIAVRESLGSS